MPKVTIYIPAMKLKVIDMYCAERKIARGVLLANAAMSVINAKGNVKCEYQSCTRPAIGQYSVIFYTVESGEEEKTLRLCEFHLQGAKKAGVVKEV